jgi:uncharacterized membrane protein
MGIAEHAGYLILRLRYYPAWSVTVNGIPVAAMAERERGLMAVPVPKGNVLVSVDWTTTGDVVAARLVSSVALLLVTGLYFFERKRWWTRSSPGGAGSLISTENPKLYRQRGQTGEMHRPVSRRKPQDVNEHRGQGAAVFRVRGG